jgi:hypothetical protein
MTSNQRLAGSIKGINGTPMTEIESTVQVTRTDLFSATSAQLHAAQRYVRRAIRDALYLANERRRN